jgi:hypothetical protein
MEQGEMGGAEVGGMEKGGRSEKWRWRLSKWRWRGRGWSWEVCAGGERVEEKVGTEDLEVEVGGGEERWNVGNVGDVAVKVRKRGGGMN